MCLTNARSLRENDDEVEGWQAFKGDGEYPTAYFSVDEKYNKGEWYTAIEACNCSRDLLTYNAGFHFFGTLAECRNWASGLNHPPIILKCKYKGVFLVGEAGLYRCYVARQRMILREGRCA